MLEINLLERFASPVAVDLDLCIYHSQPLQPSNSLAAAASDKEIPWPVAVACLLCRQGCKLDAIVISKEAAPEEKKLRASAPDPRTHVSSGLTPSDPPSTWNQR